MSGSRLGRGRVGRLALLGCATVIVIIVMFVYRSTSAEMAKLRDLHVKCAQQQEALAAQLQVIYEYKVQLEKTLSNEKSANAAAKEELQQKASRERSLRDKDSLEASQRFNALQQNYKLLQTEHQDLKDDCKKKEDVALENAKRLETTLLELRQQQKKVAEDKEKTMDNLKNKYFQVVQEKEQLEQKYNELKKVTGENSGNVEHLQKQIIQLQRELEDAKKNGALKTENDAAQSKVADEAKNNNVNNENPKLAVPADNNSMQVIRPSSQHQASVSASNPIKLAAAAPNPSESSSKPVSTANKPAALSSTRDSNNPAVKVKLPQGVPPIPRLFESANKEDARPDEVPPKQLPGVGQAPAPELAVARVADVPAARLEESANEEEVRVRQSDINGDGPNGRRIGQHQQGLGRHDQDNWYKLKVGVQEVGDPHHLEKNGFENAGANEDVEQYDDYNYKEPQNKNGDLHIEEGEDEREDEDDYDHNNMNLVKHE